MSFAVPSHNSTPIDFAVGPHYETMHIDELKLCAHCLGLRPITYRTRAHLIDALHDHYRRQRVHLSPPPTYTPYPQFAQAAPYLPPYVAYLQFTQAAPPPPPYIAHPQLTQAGPPETTTFPIANHITRNRAQQNLLLLAVLRHREFCHSTIWRIPSLRR
ncbi:hypothetical protein Slin14017_G126550 [Septoria linicola]|nr:hypothetical protein Slin14017_G126550 [Septoria linicola]